VWWVMLYGQSSIYIYIYIYTAWYSAGSRVFSLFSKWGLPYRILLCGGMSQSFGDRPCDAGASRDLKLRIGVFSRGGRSDPGGYGKKRVRCR